ncbi:hypothetical protein ACIQNG_13635 [Streptomyces sp. NPDC091377]|uniref:hypothetical protein n=1 Tax=Streptomyces sp. NPDC091377 TaxID=3365995 RepID=UPI0037F8F816
MERAQVRAGTGRTPGRERTTALELLVHGVGGATPQEMLDDPRTERVTGDETAAIYRRIEDVDSERDPDRRDDGPAGPAGPAGPVQEAYVWSNLTSGNGTRALWLLLLPFMVVNLAHWMRPATHGHARAVRLYGLLVRLAGLTLTVLLVAAACEVALDLAAWQCAGVSACAERNSWLGFFSPALSHDGWWSLPGRRIALAALVPTALVTLLWYLSHRTWSAYESARPMGGDQGEPGDGPEADPGRTGADPGRPEAADTPAADRAGDDEATSLTALGRPGFWFGRRLVARLRAAHTAAGLLTVAAALIWAAAAHDREPGGPAALEWLGGLLGTALVVGFAAVLWVVCRRGRSERRLDRELDRRLVHRLPLAAVTLLLLTVVYTGWERTGWRSTGGLPGDTAFGVLTLAQGLLVVALCVVAHVLHRARREPRCAMRGFGGPAVALLACALGGVFSGGVSQRVADWLDGPAAVIPGPPVLLTWQASVIPPLLVVLLLVAGRLCYVTLKLARAERTAVEREYPQEAADDTRLRRIARTRAMAALTDRAPLLITATALTTLLLGGGALGAALVTGVTPARAAEDTQPFLHGAAQTAQALGSWLIGVGFILFVASGRRAYKDASARRTIGILWDVGTFWPRAAHPFAPPCYAERAVPDLTWRMATWTALTGGRLVISGHSQGSVLAAAASWQLTPAVRKRVALLTYGSPLERLYGRWFPGYFGPAALSALHEDVDCWRNLHRVTDPIGGPIGLPGDCGPKVDRAPLTDPMACGRTALHPLPAPILGHSDYQADPAFAEERARLLARLRPEVPGPRPRTAE